MFLFLFSFLFLFKKSLLQVAEKSNNALEDPSGFFFFFSSFFPPFFLFPFPLPPTSYFLRQGLTTVAQAGVGTCSQAGLSAPSLLGKVEITGMNISFPSLPPWDQGTYKSPGVTQKLGSLVL